MPEVKKLNEEVQELIDLLEVARMVVSTLEIGKVLEAILKSAMRLTRTSAGSIALYNDETGEMEMKAHSGFSKDFVGDARWKVRKGGLTHRIIRSKKPTVITDTANKDFFSNPIAINEGIKSIVCVPLVLEDELIGIFYVDDFTPRRFTERELRLLYILSSFASMSINHARQHDKTVKLAVTDGLTGLYNHRHFQEVLEMELLRAERYGDNISLLMLDIDDFKRLNDRYGHQFGDRVLKKISDIMTKSCRSTDTVARYGGEEFALIMPRVPADQAAMLANRLKSQITSKTRLLMKGKGQLTVSIGLSNYPSDAKARHALVEKADKALYSAKANGKDRVVEFSNIKKASVA